MERYKIPLVNGFGRTIGYGDRWWTHRVRNGGDGPILGEKHVGITIACLDDEGRILVQHRRHRIFDKVWSLSGEPTPESMTLPKRRASLKPREGVPRKTSGLRPRAGDKYSARRILPETLGTRGIVRMNYCTFWP